MQLVVKKQIGKNLITFIFGQRRDNPNLYYLRRRDDGSLDWKDQDA